MEVAAKPPENKEPHVRSYTHECTMKLAAHHLWAKPSKDISSHRHIRNISAQHRCPKTFKELQETRELLREPLIVLRSTG